MRSLGRGSIARIEVPIVSKARHTQLMRDRGPSSFVLPVWLDQTLGATVTKRVTLQSLWSGYGRIERVACEGGRTAILKWISPNPGAPHPRGAGGAISHARKLRSYAVESAFYQDWSSRCVSARVPALLGHHVGENDERWLLLEDLDAAGYATRCSTLDDAQLSSCLRWLANFHARFLNERPLGLWPVGTYWHLATRPDELSRMAPGALKDAACELDAMLSTCRFQGLVHGDAKLANFCFGEDAVAAVDFQYVGGGCGMKDLVYFLSSAFTESECEARDQACIDLYFEHLRCALASRGMGELVDELEAEWRPLYSVAWADFHRFLRGWAPGHPKAHAFTKRMTANALAQLRRR